MKNRIPDTSQHEAVKVAGFMFLFSLSHITKNS